ncbi:GNAT family N-acetyltransferase [Egicoccus halophilus]|uniref:N-acetyltransferase domain-containing protein n=1 Tax=Egicoccus halophilus TaxID=1670830 RepID=A0A8J3ES19_9ACTN|nr:GNAT family N-acetyltransferase [Egicoccus halophilus]GGI06282.1 hypothetical protein GCM10011354_18310 [Egicoccus halophilus]
MPPARLDWTPLADAPELRDEFRRVEAGQVSPFLAAATARHRAHLDAVAADSQWLGRLDGAPVAVVRAVRLAWDGTSAGAPVGGAGDVVDAAELADRRGDADCLAVADVTVAADHRGQGIGSGVLRILPELAAGAGLERLLVLVRPHDKRHHPLVPFARYLAATDAAGRPRDGWLAAAWEAGMHPVLVVERSLQARAPLADVERFYGRAVPTSGPYLLPGAIKPAVVELERDEGRYREPHLWMAPAGHLAQRHVDPSLLRVPQDAWRRSLAAAGVVVHGRRHRRPR